MKYNKALSIEIKNNLVYHYPSLSHLTLVLFEGGSNLIFFLSPPDDPSNILFVLKIIANYKRYDFSKQDLTFMYSTKQYFSSISDSVSGIYPTVDGSLFGSFLFNNIEWIFSIHIFNKGKIDFPINEEFSYQIGQNLSKLHTQSLQIKQDYKRCYFTKEILLEGPLRLMNLHHPLVPDYSFLHDLGMSLLDHENISILAQDDYIIHGDFWHGNIIIHDKVSLIDFDFLTFGIPEMDIATMKLLGLQHAQNNSVLFHKVNFMVSSTIKGYNSFGNYHMNSEYIDFLAKVRGFWTIAAYLNSIGYLPEEHIRTKIKETSKVLRYLSTSKY